MFDNLTSSKLAYYVYALVNPLNGQVFYIGKGNGNRVFDHVNGVLNSSESTLSLKQNEISEIIQNGCEIDHYIIRHGLTENEAFLVESVLIDYNNTMIQKLTNEVSGHYSAIWGIKTAEELIRQYNAPDLEQLTDPVIIININRKYKDTKSKSTTVYNATKQAWVIDEKRLKSIKYALAEFQGIIIGVFEVKKWYEIRSEEDKRKQRWGFDGIEAAEEIKNKYLNKSIAKYKKKGAANPIRFRL